jgi:hypothetical protein
MSGTVACSRGGYFGVSSEQSRGMGHGEKDTTMNYIEWDMAKKIQP